MLGNLLHLGVGGRFGRGFVFHVLVERLVESALALRHVRVELLVQSSLSLHHVRAQLSIELLRRFHLLLLVLILVHYMSLNPSAPAAQIWANFVFEYRLLSPG